MESVSYPLRIPNKIMNLAKIRAKHHKLDQSTALRQMLYIGAEDYVLDLLKEGRISIGKGAELLNETIYDLQELARKRNIVLGPTSEQLKQSKKYAEELF